MLRSLLALSAAALAAPQAVADHVLVVGQPPSALWHETRVSTGFSVAGLADLALSSLGLRTGRFSSRSAVQSPLQADIFTHSEAFALFLLDDASEATFAALDASLGSTGAFHTLYPSQVSNLKVPVAVAQEFRAEYQSGVRCAGSVALCASVEAKAPVVNAELVQKVLIDNSFLIASDAKDVAFATELAQLIQLTDEVKKDADAKTLYVVGLSSLQGDKQHAAQKAVANAVTEFLAQLLKTKETVGAQIMTGKLPTTVQQVAALSRRGRNRRLLSGLNNEEPEEEEEEEEEEEDLDSQSGSVGEVKDNSTTTNTNTTAAGAVSMPDIAEYQIILWTSVLLGLMLLLSVLAMANMDTGRDSLLYAKFIADVNGRKTN